MIQFEGFVRSGLIHTEESKKNFLIYLTRPRHAKISVLQHQADGVLVEYTSHKLPSALFEDTEQATGLSAVDVRVPQTTVSIFIASPEPLDEHARPEILQWPTKDDCQFLVVILKLRKEESEQVIVLD